MPQHDDPIRDSLLDLTPGVGVPFLVLPSAQEVAERSGAALDEVATIMRSTQSTLEFLIAPLAKDAKDSLNVLPIRRSPSLSEQRDLLHRGMQVAMRHPNQIRLLLLLLDRSAPTIANRLADTVLYPTGLRLIGIDHEEDPTLRRRMTLVWELISIATISHRHGLEGDGAEQETLDAVVTACLGILHPPTEP